jgi:hypothetical protein
LKTESKVFNLTEQFAKGKSFHDSNKELYKIERTGLEKETIAKDKKFARTRSMFIESNKFKSNVPHLN